VESFRRHTGTAAIYLDDHVDTDRIIPARFLSRIERAGYGELLFTDVRGEGFPLDEPAARGATILVVGTNFGCGSSREHAVWAIQQAGFRVVIARTESDSPGFSDIFRQNAANNGLLLIDLEPEPHRIVSQVGVGGQLTIDLEANVIQVASEVIPFQINEANRQAILEGRDLIGTTLLLDSQISEYEKNSRSYVPRA